MEGHAPIVYKLARKKERKKNTFYISSYSKSTLKIRGSNTKTIKKLNSSDLNKSCWK